MPALETVGQYLVEARVLLQDNVVPYRYTDVELINCLNIGILEARRLRADLFLPMFEIPWVDPTLPDPMPVKVPLDAQYRAALVYYIVGRAQLRDDEATTDSRAAAFMGRFAQQLLTVTPA